MREVGGGLVHGIRVQCIKDGEWVCVMFGLRLSMWAVFPKHWRGEPCPVVGTAARFHGVQRFEGLAVAPGRTYPLAVAALLEVICALILCGGARLLGVV